MIPLNTTYDKTDCSNGCTVQKGAYANAEEADNFIRSERDAWDR